ncbi:Sec region non-globular protein [Leptospira yanagawae serovar Saopaulo str. Sao Paulo = ATCC 700523]|uniref:Sec region non-globular protein n=1 Tax=Leptospira yanagawae serovar Saopaulo str. Sao Paulo = ATCC 700523 TaxID=1249483 RepID=A0A5E8HJ02_9LEPT|nr:SRP-less Sec system protein [Leptospira yanagawae]EOQ90480.1 Sec region non-globular protein [Leptospira yanagawae serovar Saopaulo str. Sao Paulo = ATCC 700523]
MKSFFSILIFLGLTTSLFSQEGLDFLDKVNDKPKTTTKPKEDTVQTTTKKQSGVVTTTGVTSGKKKKSKKKSKQNQLATENLPQNNNLVANPNGNPVVTEKTLVPGEKQPAVLEEEEVVSNAYWMDSQVSVEPTGLPGFSSDLKLAKSEVSNSTSESSVNKDSGKSFFNVSDFFAKYKKAMMILGIIILFAFYRLRSARPGSSSRSYRR